MTLEIEVKKILKRNLIADFVDVFSLMIILLPLIIYFASKATIFYMVAILTVFFLFFYYLSRKDIQKIKFYNDQIKITHLFRLKNKSDLINYSIIKSVSYSSTPSGFSSVTISYLVSHSLKKFIMNGRGITRKNKTYFIEFLRSKNEKIIFEGF